MLTDRKHYQISAVLPNCREAYCHYDVMKIRAVVTVDFNISVSIKKQPAICGERFPSALSLCSAFVFLFKALAGTFLAWLSCNARR
jgi:hypothetical protein